MAFLRSLDLVRKHDFKEPNPIIEYLCKKKANATVMRYCKSFSRLDSLVLGSGLIDG